MKRRGLDKKRKLKFIFLLIGILILLVGGLFWYRYYIAKGSISLTVVPAGAKVELAGSKYDLNDGNLNLKLKKGTYSILIEADGYLAYDDILEVEPSKTTRRIISLDKMFYMNSLDTERDSGDLEQASYFPKFVSDGNKIVYFSPDSKKFLSFSTASENQTHLAVNDMSKELGLDLKLTDNDQVYRINYSLDGSKAIIIYETGDESQRLKFASFADKKVIDFPPNITSADFLDNSKIVAVKDKVKVIAMNTGLTELETYVNSDREYTAIFAVSSRNMILVDNNGQQFMLDNSSKGLKTVSTDGAVIKVLPSPDRNGNALVLMSQDEFAIPYLTKPDGSSEKKEVCLASGENIAWLDSERLIFLDSQDESSADFRILSVNDNSTDDKNSTTLHNIDPNLINGLIAANGKSYFIFDSTMMGFNITNE